MVLNAVVVFDRSKMLEMYFRRRTKIELSLRYMDIQLWDNHLIYSVVISIY